MLCLSIETSCDETSLAILYNSNFENSLNDNFLDYINSFTILGQIISSQIDLHKNFGGVIPEIGAREHATQIHFLFEEVLQISLKNWNKITNVEQNINKNQQIKINNNNQNLVNSLNCKDLSINSQEKLEQNNSKNSHNKFNLSKSFSKKVYYLPDIFGNLEYIFVTTTPGLTSALRVGIEFAKTLVFFVEQNYQKKVKIVPINHLQGHLASSFWQNK